MIYTPDTKFTKGKHKGKTLKEVLIEDDKYVGFLVRECKWFSMNSDAWLLYREGGYRKNPARRLDMGRK